MFHLYDGYHWLGMHLAWWLFWIAFIGVVFGLYPPAPRKRGRDDVPK